MNETSKAMRRRYVEQHLGKFDWWRIFSGRGLDIGAGPDPHPMAAVTFDVKDGDANHLSQHVRELFDWIHASQCLEHMHDPWLAMLDWLQVLKPGGHAVITVPCWEIYEGKQWPSRYNPDHKSTWSMWQEKSPAPHHVLVPQYLKRLETLGHSTVLVRMVDNNYDYNLGTKRDQTWHEADAVEAFIEFVIQKSHA